MTLSYEASWAHFLSLYPPALIELLGGALIQYAGVLIGAAAATYIKPSLRPSTAKTLPLALFNITLGAFAHLLCLLALSQRTQKPLSTVSLTTMDPSFPQIGPMLAVFAQGFFLFDVYFYTVHAILHKEPLYRYFHSWHHGVKDKTPTAAYYNHPVEHVFVHMVGSYWIPVFAGAHVLSFFAAGLYYAVSAQVVHSGLYMPFMNHDGHDIDLGKNVGAFGMLDLCLGSFMSRGEVTEWERKWTSKVSKRVE
ncbi:hypothetical protein BDV25DRAFT_143490 [Aspergillus avenaceus]|uniref:Fatty acid hydroxylase domain-containing protein n=1 Tax=Aspergillus avenaceus TaxID=36643 RepID=A0A5N6TK65_ASPAV|nr:hypothetical protein BDV25DRAFT_143490 [Aspergillus avenaceus]